MLAILSVFCILFDRSGSAFHQWRIQSEVIARPVQLLVSQPIQWAHRAMEGLTEQQHLLDENKQLGMRIVMLQSQVQKLLELQRENQQLKVLLKSTSNITGQVKLAELLAVSLDPSLHQLILNRGLEDHIYIGQPVLDAYGVMGQVISVSNDVSKVLLLTDSHSAIPVEDYRNGVRAVAAGEGNDQSLKLLNVSTMADIKPGDVFVTSGYAQHFPSGYPVGVVTGVKHQVGQAFLNVGLLPSAHLDQTQHVLLVWPGQLKVHKQVEKLLKQKLPQPKAIKI